MDPVTPAQGVQVCEKPAEEKEVMIASPASSSVHPSEFGGKATGLFRLGQIPRVATAPWFSVSVNLFKEHLYASGCDALVACSDNFEAIQKRLIAHPLSSTTREIIARELQKIGETERFAVRSSGVTEDGSKASFAGLFHTELNVVGMDAIEKAIKEVWASAFSEQVVAERNRHSIPHTESAMSVVIQKLVDAKASAVISTTALGTGYPGFEISANFGLGLSVVDGDVSTDSWVLHPKQGYILEQHRGKKDSVIILSAKGGLEKKEQENDAFCLDRKELHEIYLTISSIKEVMGFHVDVEVAFESSGQMITLQVRPLVMKAHQTTLVVDKKAAENHREVAQSTYALPGVVSGRLVYVKNWQELADGKVKIGKGDIALAHITTNSWSQHLANVSGMITREGSASSHPMLLSREKGCPCLTGISDKDEFDALIALDGKTVTLDGHNRLLYEGDVSVCEAQVEDLMHHFDTIPIRPWPSNEMDLESMRHNEMIFEVDGILYRKTPTFSLQALQAEINVMREALTPEVIGKPIKGGKVLFKDGFVGCEMRPYHDYINSFKDHTIDEATAFNQRGREWTRKLLEISENFTPENWDEFVDVYAKMRTFVWMSGALRYVAERHVDTIGTKIELPKYYLEMATKQIQSTFHELDTEMQKDVHDLALQLVDHEPVDDVSELKDTPLYEQIVALGQKYRFEHQMALHLPADFNYTYKRLKTEVEHIKSGAVFRSQKHKQSREFLPEQGDLTRWLTVSIENRLLQSDAHHVESRVKAIMRGKLIAWRGENVFNMSIEEIRCGKS